MSVSKTTGPVHTNTSTIEQCRPCQRNNQNTYEACKRFRHVTEGMPLRIRTHVTRRLRFSTIQTRRQRRLEQKRIQLGLTELGGSRSRFAIQGYIRVMLRHVSMKIPSVYDRYTCATKSGSSFSFCQKEPRPYSKGLTKTLKQAPSISAENTRG